jgi:hypothetical protein
LAAQSIDGALNELQKARLRCGPNASIEKFVSALDDLKWLPIVSSHRE